MSNFTNKIQNGQSPTDEDWTDHLLEAHNKAPSMTPDAFASYQTSEGKNSYQILADKISPNTGHIVDLACGDGHLIPHLLPKLSHNGKISAVDMSAIELAIARRTVKDPRVSFFQAKAQNLPLGDRS